MMPCCEMLRKTFDCSCHLHFCDHTGQISADYPSMTGQQLEHLRRSALVHVLPVLNPNLPLSTCDFSYCRPAVPGAASRRRRPSTSPSTDPWTSTS